MYRISHKSGKKSVKCGWKFSYTLKWSATAIQPTFTKLTLARQAPVKNSYIEFHVKELNNRLIADSRLQTDGRMSPCKASFSYLVVNTPNKRSKRFFFPSFVKYALQIFYSCSLTFPRDFSILGARPVGSVRVAYTQYVTGLNILELHVHLEVVSESVSRPAVLKIIVTWDIPLFLWISLACALVKMSWYKTK